MTFEFHTTIRDKTVKVVVTNYQGPKPMKITGSGYGDAIPADEVEFEYHLEPPMELTEKEDEQVFEDFLIMDMANDHGY